MKLELKSAAVRRGLPAVSLTIESGQAAYIATTTDQRPTILGLISTGRMKLTDGEALIDGMVNRRQLRHRSALIDAPVVSAPVDDVWLIGLVSEELTFAGRWGGLRSVLRWLNENNMRQYSRTIAANLPPAIRIKVLLELATLREGTDLLVLVSPDRHGANPDEWWPILEDIAARGFAVLAIVGEPTAELLGQMGVRCAGAHDDSAMLTPKPTEPLVFENLPDDVPVVGAIGEYRPQHAGLNPEGGAVPDTPTPPDEPSLSDDPDVGAEYSRSVQVKSQMWESSSQEPQLKENEPQGSEPQETKPQGSNPQETRPQENEPQETKPQENERKEAGNATENNSDYYR